MIRLKPDPENPFVCPECGTRHPVIKDVIVSSVHVLADCSCPVCGLEFYQGYPVGHAVLEVLSLGKSSGKLYPGKQEHIWLSESFQRALRGTRKNAVPIRKVIYRKCEDVIILNTLDSLYGHSLLKLYNALHHIDHHPELGLIVIVPKVLEWLIPKGCAEAWIVDAKLSDLAFGHDAIQKFISIEFNRFRKIFLSRAYSHPAPGDGDVARLTGVVPFNLADFNRIKPTITFVLREDRFWFSGGADYLFYRVCRKLKWLRWGQRILAVRQNGLVKKAIRRIRAKVPEANFYVVGMGTTGSFSGYAIDERQDKVDVHLESRWCRIYAHSHVVMGIHGSNMLLPTAMAAGCVEILPEDRYGNIVQDLTVRYADRRQLFFYRFAAQYESPGVVGNMIAGMIRDYPLYHLNMCVNAYGNPENPDDSITKALMTTVIENLHQ